MTVTIDVTAGEQGGRRYNIAMITALTPPNQSVILPGVSWATYESLLKDYASFRGIRLNYDRGKLEIMTPGFEQESANRDLETTIEAIVEGKDSDVMVAGSTTFKREDLERGFEPDSSFYFQRAAEMRAKREMDLAVDPAPELVIEVDDTSPSLNKLPLYASVGVREVWRYRDGRITMYGLDRSCDEPVYRECESGLAFPELHRAKLEEFKAQSRTMRRPEWMRSIREWAKQQQ